MKDLQLRWLTTLENRLFSSCNMSETESSVRIILSSMLLTLSLVYSMPIVMMFAVMLAMTGILKHCFMYRLFNINRKVALEAFYLKNLPKNNPQPVLILDKDAIVIFKNEPAKQHLNINYFQEVLDENIKEIIKKEKTVEKQYTSSENRTYLLVFKGVKKLNYILTYATDITAVLEAEQEIIDIQKDVVYTMGSIGESRSKETGNHVKRVALYSELLALKYGLSKDEAELLKLASPMHDIGKVGIKDEILNKPAKLTNEEFKIMKTHSALGFNMLKNSDKPILKTAAIVAHEHHEKWDGSGYPKKLKGEDIHIYGRITALADVFDALGSKRVYKDAWELEKIVEFFHEQKGKHFDPKLVEIFFDNFEEFDKIRMKYQD